MNQRGRDRNVHPQSTTQPPLKHLHNHKNHSDFQTIRLREMNWVPSYAEFHAEHDGTKKIYPTHHLHFKRIPNVHETPHERAHQNHQIIVLLKVSIVVTRSRVLSCLEFNEESNDYNNFHTTLHLHFKLITNVHDIHHKSAYYPCSPTINTSPSIIKITPQKLAALPFVQQGNK